MDTEPTPNEDFVVVKPRGRARNDGWLTRPVVVVDSTTPNLCVATVHGRSVMKFDRLKSARSLATDPEEHIYEAERSYTIIPATWLLRLGLNYGLYLAWLSSSTQVWKQTLDAFRTVPHDATIFQSCHYGDLTSMQTLISEGRASVRDTDNRGRTLLHVSLKSQ